MPAIDEIMTISLLCCRFISFETASVIKTVGNKFCLYMAFHKPSVFPKAFLGISGASFGAAPMLLTKTSIRPNSSIVLFTKAKIVSGSVASPCH